MKGSTANLGLHVVIYVDEKEEVYSGMKNKLEI